MSTTQERVAAGAALLDERLPGWRKVIDADSLRLDSGCYCVLGQLFGSYEQGVIALALDNDEVADLGFHRSLTSRSKWTTLTNAWRRVLR